MRMTVVSGPARLTTRLVNKSGRWLYHAFIQVTKQTGIDMGVTM